MPEHNFHLSAVLQVLENGTYLGEALYYPEASCVDDNPAALVRALGENARQLLRKVPQAELFRRRGPRDVRAEPVTVELPPPRHSPAWRDPVRLTLPTVRWRHGDEARVAFVPALGIEVVAAEEEHLEPMLQRHIRVALARLRALTLQGLTWLDRCERLLLEGAPFVLELPSPRQSAIAEAEQRQARESILPEVATDLVAQPLEPAYEMDEPLRRLAEALTGRTPRCVLVVGPSGVGKTALAHELARRRGEVGLGSTPFWATSGARLVAGMSGFGMWQDRCQRLWREASRLRAILHLGNLIELMEVGKSEHQAQGLASFLRPYLARGDLLAICECTPEQVPIVERLDPHLLRAFVQVRLEEP